MKVSVCVATYNGARYVELQVRSILSELDEDDELIVSDDGSSDSTISILRRIGDKRINIIDGPRNGIVKNFEGALKVASGDFVFMSDQDDVWIKGKKQLFLDQRAQGFTAINSDCIVVKEDLTVLHNSLFQLHQSKPGFAKNLIKNTYVGCCMGFDRSILNVALPFPKFIPMHDMWIGLVGEISGRVCFLSTPTLLYRRHDANASATSGRSSNALWKKIWFRVIMFLYIPLIYFRIIVNRLK